MVKQTLIRFAMLALCLSASAFAQAEPPLPNGVLLRASSAGNVLTDARGMTLYTLDKDVPGKSVCNDQCAVLWPPLLAKPGATAPANWSIIVRDDGSKQWAYKGKPLYTFKDDSKPGDVTGNGLRGVWHTAIAND
jgi:predicted lipoprotein with Yx(FWY)xxD motif